MEEPGVPGSPLSRPLHAPPNRRSNRHRRHIANGQLQRSLNPTLGGGGEVGALPSVAVGEPVSDILLNCYEIG